MLNRIIVIYAKVGHPQEAYLPKMPKLAFLVNTDLLSKLLFPGAPKICDWAVLMLLGLKKPTSYAGQFIK